MHHLVQSPFGYTLRMIRDNAARDELSRRRGVPRAADRFRAGRRVRRLSAA